MLRLDNVWKRYPEGVEALSGVNFNLDRGEMAFLTGHSGAGKSTLLKLIALIDLCTLGHVLLDGQNLSSLKEREIPFLRRKLGLIFQDYKLLHDRTLFDRDDPRGSGDRRLSAGSPFLLVTNLQQLG